MVGTALPRVTSSEGLLQDDHHYEKPRCKLQARSTSHYPRQQQAKHCQGGDAGNRIGQRGTKGADHRFGGAPDVTGRINLPSSACSSGRSQSNLDRFLVGTTPRVKTQIGRKSSFHNSSHMMWYDPEETRFFNLGELWDSFDEWSAYGAGVSLMLNGDESVVQYYVPYLSALQLFIAPKSGSHSYLSPQRGSESDPGSDASSDGESEKSFRECKGAESPLPNLGGSSGNNSMLECKIEEKREVWSYFEKNPPYCRVPLVDKIADLSRAFEAEPDRNPLRAVQSSELLPNSWFSVAWYPIYRIPTGPTLRDLAACFLTFHPLSTPLPAGDGSLRQSNGSGVCVLPTRRSQDVLPLPAFGLASYKLRGAVWSSNPEKRLATELELSAYEHLTNLGVQHHDFNYFTSHTLPIRR